MAGKSCSYEAGYFTDSLSDAAIPNRQLGYAKKTRRVRSNHDSWRLSFGFSQAERDLLRAISTVIRNEQFVGSGFSLHDPSG
jgi:hypothetical protein